MNRDNQLQGIADRSALLLVLCLSMGGCGITIKEKQKSVPPPMSEDAQMGGAPSGTFGIKRQPGPLQDLAVSIIRQTADAPSDRASFLVTVRGRSQSALEKVRQNFKIEACLRGQTEGGVICAYEALDPTSWHISEDSSAGILKAELGISLAGADPNTRMQLRVQYCESKCVQSEVSFAADPHSPVNTIEPSSAPAPFKTL